MSRLVLKESYYKKLGKQYFDLSLTGFSLFFIIPVIVIISVLIKKFQHGPVLFSQTRPGYMGLPFQLYKFCTMTDAKDVNGNLLPDNERITDLGNFLRSTSLDELPELLNVLKGDMSIVGPRPLLMQYLDRFTLEQARRHEVKPGLTGWAQINGRNAISWEEKFRLDVWYVDNQSFWLDLKIVALTIFKVLRREGISYADEATMPEFLGTKKEQF